MNFLLFQLKVAVLLLVFYAIFKITISKSAQFGYKRLFILVSIVLAHLAPFITIELDQSSIFMYYQQLPEAVIGAYSGAISSEVDYREWLFYLFISLSFLVLIFFAISLLRIFRLINTSTIKKENGYVLVETKGEEAFTFIHYIFLGKHIREEDRPVILQHEKVHAKYLHSLDNILIELVLITQWFNPVVWLFRKALKENHEFEADSVLLNQGVSINSYQQLLLNQMFQTRGIRFSSFNYNSFIKNRIKMMTNMNTRAGKTRFLLAAIMCLFVVSVFSFKVETITQFKEEVKNLGQELTNLPVKDTIKDKKSEIPFLVVDESATFQGKDLTEFNNYIIKNVKYPPEAVQKKIQGKVYVQFVVEKNGTIKEAAVLRGVAETLDKEALRVIRSSPAWTPAKKDGRNVRQVFTLPVVFKLQK